VEGGGGERGRGGGGGCGCGVECGRGEGCAGGSLRLAVWELGHGGRDAGVRGFLGGGGFALPGRRCGGLLDASDVALGRRRRGGAVAVGRVRDAELRAVLVVARAVVDDLQAVVRDVGLEACGGRPGEGAAVGDGFVDAGDGEDVGGGAAEEDEGDGAGGCGLPCYGEGDAGGDDLVEAGWRGGGLVRGF